MAYRNVKLNIDSKTVDAAIDKCIALESYFESIPGLFELLCNKIKELKGLREDCRTLTTNINTKDKVINTLSDKNTALLSKIEDLTKKQKNLEKQLYNSNKYKELYLRLVKKIKERDALLQPCFNKIHEVSATIDNVSGLEDDEIPTN